MRRYTFFSLLVILTTIYLDCDIKNTIKSPVEGVKVILNSAPVETFVSGEFVDARTGAVLENTTIVISIEGQDKDAVIDVGGAPSTLFTIKDGTVDFALADGVTPSQDSPVELIISANAKGYIPTSKPCIIKQSGIKTFQIWMVAKENPPEGVDVTKSNSGATDSNGNVTSDVSISTESGASVTLPRGTSLRDAQGNPLRGSLTTNFTYYNPQSMNAIKAVPGGRSLVNNSLGWVSVQINDASGRNADSIGGGLPATVWFPIAQNAINPLTNAPFMEGDSVDIVKYHIDTGEIEPSGRGICTYQAGGSLLRKSLVTNSMASSDLGVEAPTESVLGENVVAGAVYFDDKKDQSSCQDFEITVDGIPEGLPLFLQAIKELGGNLQKTVYDEISYNRIFFFNNCEFNGDKYRIYLNNPDEPQFSDPVTDEFIVNASTSINGSLPPGYAPINFAVSGICKDQIVIRPDLPIRYRMFGASNWTSARLTQGKVTLWVKLGVIYEIKAEYEEESGWVKVRFNDQTSYEILEHNGDDGDTVAVPTVDYSTNPPTLEYQIDLGDYCN